MENQISNTNTIQSNINSYNTVSTTGNNLWDINNGGMPLTVNQPSTISISPASVDWESLLPYKKSERVKELEGIINLLLDTINEGVEDINKEVDSIVNMIRKRPDNTNIYNNLLQSLLGRRDSFLKIKNIIDSKYKKEEATEEN